METKDIVLVSLSILSLIWGYAQKLKSDKTQDDRDNNKAQWRRLDELKIEVSAMRELIRSEYMTARQVQEFFQLSTEPWIVKLDHIDQQLSELKHLFERKFP